MHYLGAVRRVLSDLPIYFIVSLLIFIPGANIAIIGYLVSLAGRAGDEAPFGKFIDRFSEGVQIIAIALMYSVLPLLIYNLYSLRYAVIFSCVLIPAFVFSIAMLGNGSKLGEILQVKNVSRAYSPGFIWNMIKASIFSLLVAAGHILIPIAGWIGILFGPLAVFITLMGEVYQDYFIQ
ncbi:MAG: hypothetical protein GOV00_02695 [Candidatus Altiarchaeota archaeon]|nr:hypothetical protein [Candidatus Altiarchaeota archaeon]